MEILIVTIVFLVMLTVLVLVHEFGHFIIAKKNGILVEEFGIGFPPRIWGIKKGETIYSINALPIGGFVKLYGEEYHEEDNVKVDPNLKERAFINKKPWQKVSVIVAGVVMNFILAWAVISFLFTQGVPTPTKNVLIDRVQPNSPAAQAGIKEGDNIIEIRAKGKTYPLNDTNDMISLSKKFAGEPVTFILREDGRVKSITLTPRKNPPPGEGPLGVVITSFVNKKYPWYQAPFYGLIHSFQITRQIIVELGKTFISLFTAHRAKVDVTGPIGIAVFTGQAIKLGHNAVLELLALLSLNLAVVNILPFPALDGGRLVFVLYEWITKRRVNRKVEQYTNLIGMATLLLLALLITVNDIRKINIVAQALRFIHIFSK